ncbi:histidine phosphatase family protein [Clostridium estertheticum]|uniref:Phosphoglycerate kinase n=2 Tax=Clostridium estertheticum TaxID=238834 RepID=A0A1J0GGI3_9CLOT|nr:histidine phosphatase family protein [Clostridium estertheticum]APC40473.1 phosphoglycerate kinase [Clostridium estertheticum subsp. estertheticum]MBU3075081.1 histidine phosphatase family protein [Clostridium estertheticum]MBU3165296.1 histidine phosphatase family protein [Clostridium estertheticum]MBU3173053.1 histidine phosphatase family protein [Clostridium estertheticum]MBZ9617701.1 histidine phosphatase family protein [Clostridium estertheticum subsp. laramiense]
MNTTITLVRHGETNWNVLGKFQGCKDIILSNEGILQAQYLNERFQNKFDYIYTSPLKRAHETAEIISKGSDIIPMIEPGIKEIDFGEWEGLTIKEVETNYPKELVLWRSDELNGPMCGGEISLKIASMRAKKAILKIATKHPGKKIIIVAHGGIIKAGLLGIFDLKMTMYHKIILGNTSVCKIIFDNELNPKIITLNDTSHLPDNYRIKSYV